MTYQAVFKTCLAVLACILLSGPFVDVRVVAARRQVNCARYPYAPVCLGVAAKRGLIPTTDVDDVISLSDSLDNTVLRSVLSSMRRDDSRRMLRSPDRFQALTQQDQPQQNYYLQQKNDEDSLLLPKLLIKRSVKNPAGL